jgi:hypothetical protein
VKKMPVKIEETVSGQPKEGLSDLMNEPLCMKVLDSSSFLDCVTQIFREIFGGTTSQVRLAYLRKGNTVGLLMRRYLGTLGQSLLILETSKTIGMIREL